MSDADRMRKASANRIGTEGYVRILGAIREKPLSSDEIAELAGVHRHTAVRLMCWAKRMGLVHREQWFQPRANSRWVPKWGIGAEGDVSMPEYETPSKSVPRAALIQIGALVQIMCEEPRTAAEIAVELGVHKETALQLIACLRKHGLSTIAGWDRTTNNLPVAQHRWLGTSDAPRPKRQNLAEAQKRWHQRHKAKVHHIRMLQAMGANVPQFKEAA